MGLEDIVLTYFDGLLCNSETRISSPSDRDDTIVSDIIWKSEAHSCLSRDVSTDTWIIIGCIFK